MTKTLNMYCTCSTYRRSCPPLLDEEAAPEVKEEEEELDESATEVNSVEQQDAVALGGESSEK
jgi:hypothetical protein